MPHQELYKAHRPKKLSEVIGQDTAVNQIRKAIKEGKLAHSVLLNGPTGTGKTTLMRIIRTALRCSNRDYTEINTADFRGIDTIRDLRRSMNLMPMGGETRVIGIDECHMLSKDAQNAILKMLEDTPEHVYFLLGTTDPQKLLPAVLGRCSEFKLKALSVEDLEKLLTDVVKKEGMNLGAGMIEDIAQAAGGSARKALVILEAVAKEEGEEAQKRAIQITTVDKDLAYKLASEVMWPKQGWNGVAQILQKMKDEDPEGVRHLVLAFARSCLVGKEGQNPKPNNLGRAALVIDCFGSPFYDSKQAGLAFACFRVLQSR